MKGSGWRGESRRHSLARRGIKTAQKIPVIHIKKPLSNKLPYKDELINEIQEEITDDMRYQDNFNIGIVDNAIKQIISDYESRKESHKSNMGFARFLEKYEQGSYQKYKDKLKELNTKLKTLKKIKSNPYSFLRKGKYHKGWLGRLEEKEDLV